jgi:benzylsuccinate CoA-transferase BbsF subunit
MPARPLDGVRVVDFTWVRAGPWATRWLAVLGAEVIKVEWPDPARGGNVGGGGQPPPGIPPGRNSGGSNNDSQAMKHSLTLNMRSERGREAMYQLVAKSDVVIENFSAGVLTSWEMSFPQMQAINPGIIYVSMAGFGQTGPLKDWVTMGPTVQAVSGLTTVSGLPDKQPAGWGWSYMDDTGGMFGAMSVLTALLHRQRTGEGQHVDMSQVSTGMTLLGPAFLDYTANGRGSRRPGYPPGNRSVWPGTEQLYNYRGPICAPHNAYRTKGGGYNDWAGIVCESDEEWQRLVRLMGSPDWATDPRLATLVGRLESQEQMDQNIQEWTQTLEKYELADLCQKNGVRAMPVQGSDEKFGRDPQLHARGHYDPAFNPVIGWWPQQQSPWKMSRTPTPVDRGAPMMGGANVEVLCGLLGMTPEELRSGYEDNSFWPQSVPLEPYLVQALEEADAHL